jgi:hypothetical protein
MLAAAEDIGRRGVNVAHVGDMKAFSAMRLVGEGDVKPPPSADLAQPPPSADLAPPANQEQGASSSSGDATSQETAESPPESASPSPSASASPAAPPAQPLLSQAHAHLKEALALYVYALKLMKGAVSAAQRVMDVVRATLQQQQAQQPHIGSSGMGGVMDTHQALLGRCDVSLKWLNGQFNGILERAEAGQKQVRRAKRAQ